MLLLMLMSAGAAVAAGMPHAHVCRAMWFVGRTD